MKARSSLALTLYLLTTSLAAAPARAEGGADEPGASLGPDEPGIVVVRGDGGGTERPFQLELGFGWASLLEDPDVGEGFGAGINFSYEIGRRIGAELSFFFSKNPYDDTLGDIGTNFLAGSITLGPTVRLTPDNSRIKVTADLGLGPYVIIPYLVDNTWTLGISGGLTMTLRIASWFGVAVKMRYHLFNLATLGGPELRDLKAFMKVGVIDRFELPICLVATF